MLKGQTLGSMPRRWKRTRRCGRLCGGTREKATKVSAAAGAGIGDQDADAGTAARLDRKRAGKGSNEDWEHPHDPDARIAKLKDGGRTWHTRWNTRWIQQRSGGGGDAATGRRGDTATGRETVCEAGEQIATVAVKGRARQ